MSTFALRQTYPFTQHIGVESVLQRDAGHRGARLRTGGNHVVFKGLGVTFALRRRIDYAYFVHDRCPLKNRWTLSNQEHIGSRCDGRTVTIVESLPTAHRYCIGHDLYMEISIVVQADLAQVLGDAHCLASVAR